MDTNDNTYKIELIKTNWDEIISRIREEYQISDIVYNTWLEPLSPYSFSNNTVVISIASDNNFFVDYITKKYTEVFQVAVGELLGKMVSVSFRLEQDLQNMVEVQENPEEEEKPALS